MSFSALVIHPDVDARMRFKSAATSLTCFNGISLVSTLDEGRSKLEKEKNIELIYLSSRYDQAVSSEFIRYGKSGPSKAAGYVLMVNGNQIKSQSMASYLMDGIDGVLPEPFSPESLQKSTERVASVVHSRKKRLALEVFAHQAVESVDRLSENFRRGISSPQAFKSLQDSQRVISQLEDDEFEYYVSQLITAFGEAKPFVPEPIVQARAAEYHGPSDRVRRMILKKLK